MAFCTISSTWDMRTVRYGSASMAYCSESRKLFPVMNADKQALERWRRPEKTPQADQRSSKEASSIVPAALGALAFQ